MSAWVPEASKCVKHIPDQLLWTYQNVPTSMEEEMHACKRVAHCIGKLRLTSSFSPQTHLTAAPDLSFSVAR